MGVYYITRRDGGVTYMGRECVGAANILEEKRDTVGGK